MTIESYIISPNPIAFHVFDQQVADNAVLYVPSQSLEQYTKTSGWSRFKSIAPIGSRFGGSLALSVIDEQDNEITDEVNIVWYDGDGKQIGTGSILSGVADSTEVYYTILLDEVLGRVYREVKAQGVIASGDTVICQLEKIGKVTLEGRVSATDIEKMVATVNVKQMLNGKYEEVFMTQTNEKGEFLVTVFDDETDITISREDCFDAIFHRDSFNGDGDIGIVPLNLISGFVITPNIAYLSAVAVGETAEEITWNDGLNNIEFTLTNRKKGNEITDFVTQNGNLIIKAGADTGDEISLVAKSKRGVFVDATATFIVKENATAFNLQLTELGGFNAVCTGSNNGGTTGYLYDSNGILVGKGNYVGETLMMRHLPDGTYMLVSMGRSLLLGNLARLTDLADVGLSEGKDYVTTRVEVVDGELTEVSVTEVPRLNEAQFYYTTGNTYFNANASSVTAGDYLSLSARVDFKKEYADNVNGVTLIIDLPEGCQMLENSVITNHQAVIHSVNGNRVTLSLTKEQCQNPVLFCITPTLNKTYSITAIASFDIDGKVMQPIGTAQFEAKGLSLSVPQYAANTTVTVNGTASGGSEVSIYDNDVYVGKTTSKADGTWSSQIELYKPYNNSYHDIYLRYSQKMVWSWRARQNKWNMTRTI